MFRQRLYNLVSSFLLLANKFNVSCVYLNCQSLSFECLKNNKFCFKMYLNFALLIVWLCGIIYQTMCRVLTSHYSSAYLGLTYTVTLTLLIFTASIPLFFSPDICPVLNGFFGLFRFLHSKQYVPIRINLIKIFPYFTNSEISNILQKFTCLPWCRTSVV